MVYISSTPSRHIVNVIASMTISSVITILIIHIVCIIFSILVNIITTIIIRTNSAQALVILYKITSQTTQLGPCPRP